MKKIIGWAILSVVLFTITIAVPVVLCGWKDTLITLAISLAVALVIVFAFFLIDDDD